MIGCQGPREVECCRLHAKRIEDFLLHGPVVCGPKVHVGINNVSPNVPCGGSHEIAILKNLAELAGWLHRGKHLEYRLWRGAFKLKQPLVILTRHPRASQIEIFYEHLFRDIEISQLQLRVPSCHGSTDLSLFHRPIRRQGGCSCPWRGRHEQGVSFTGSDLSNSRTPSPPSYSTSRRRGAPSRRPALRISSWTTARTLQLLDPPFVQGVGPRPAKD